jgi:colicin import membrane protein
MNTVIETELRTLLDNVNKTLALKMSEKHGLDYDEVYEFLTTSMNEDKAPVSRGRPKKEKKTITENHKDTSGKPDVNHIIKEIMEKDAELEELTEDEIDEDVVVSTKEASPLTNNDKDNDDNDNGNKNDDKKPKEKAKRKPAAPVSDEEKAKAAEEKEKAKEAKAAEKKAEAEKAKEAKAAEKKAEAEKAKEAKAAEKKAEAEKAKAAKAAEKASEKEAAKAEKKTKGKAAAKKEEKVEVAASVEEESAAGGDEDEDEDEDGGFNACEFEFDGKMYLKQEYGTAVFDVETHEELGEWDEKNNKIVFNS